MSDAGGYLHLNRDGLWPGFERLSLDEGPLGELTLATLPRLDAGGAGADAVTLRSLGAPASVEAIAASAEGVFWTDAAAGAVWRQDPCDGHRGRVPLSRDAGGLARPGGLAIHPGRGALLVADTGHDRILLFDLDGYALIGLWDGAGGFSGPTALAVDSDGSVYTVDRGNQRVRKLTADGVPVAAFETASAGELIDPSAVAVTGPGREDDGDDLVLVLDEARRAILLFAHDGTPVDALALAFDEPAGLAATGSAIYVGDNQRRRIFRVGRDGKPLGEARGFEGPVAALALDGSTLWLHPGAGRPARLAAAGAYTRQGLLWGGPVEVDGRPHAWHRLHAIGETIPDGTGLSLFVHPQNGGAAPPAPDPAKLAETGGGLDPDAWRLVGPGAGDALAGESSRRLWVAALFSGSGDLSPRIGQLRLAYDHTGYEAHLPVIYRVPDKITPDAGGEPELLRRFLALFESFFADLGEEISDLSTLFDPAVAPPGWLEWLAEWLAFDLEEGWTEEKKRRLLDGAFAAYAARGTARGLEATLAARLGVRASVEEPHAQTDWWALPDADGPNGARDARLGFSTRLAAAHPQGAVAGSSATLDASHLIEEDDFGAPLFSGTAYRFSVVVPRSQISAPESRARLEELIEQEKPAHTDYRICAVEPGVLVGVQSLVGVDTILGGGAAPVLRLGEAGPFTVGGQPPGRVGVGRVGRDTRLAGGAAECAARRSNIDQAAGAVAARARKEESWAPSRA